MTCVTQRSVLTTPIKLTVQALVFGEWGARQMRHPTTMDGLVSPEPRMARGDLVLCPASGVAFKEFASLLT
ncbi:MAG TPA: hypothetical protein VMW91_12010 [Desulfosporosinus sp.]|nr:hypothetical protein [Desulfosporosinus sp.]